MNNAIYTTDLFERQKRIKASLITLAITIALYLLAILLKWSLILLLFQCDVDDEERRYHKEVD